MRCESLGRIYLTKMPALESSCLPFSGRNFMVAELTWQLKAMLHSFVFYDLEVGLFTRGQKEWALQTQSLECYQHS